MTFTDRQPQDFAEDRGPQHDARLHQLLCDYLERSLAMIGARRFYRSMYLGAGRFRVRHEELEVQGLPSGLDGLTIAHLSDLHAGAFVRSGDLQYVVKHVNELEVDLVALTGDYISHDATDISQLSADLRALRSRWGSYAVLGNHDYRAGRVGTVIDCFTEFGVRFLRNEGVRLDSGNGALYLSGVEDLKSGARVDAHAARTGMRPGDFEVLLCHQPRGLHELARKECILMLSGHTHGSQLNLPAVRRLGPHHPGDRVEHGSTTCIVNGGLGAIGLPLRLRAPAEVVIVTLKSRARA